MTDCCYVVKAPRMNEMAQWLKCNDVDPHLVPYNSPVFVESHGQGWTIRHEVYARSESGFLLYDAASRTYACEERLAPLVNDPPMWWLEAAPTGDGAAPAGPASSEVVSAGDDTVAERVDACD